MSDKRFLKPLMKEVNGKKASCYNPGKGGFNPILGYVQQSFTRPINLDIEIYSLVGKNI